MGTLQYPKPGDRGIKVGDQVDIINAAKAHKRANTFSSVTPPQRGHGRSPIIKNGTGGALERFNVLAIDTFTIFAPSDNLVEFKDNWALTGITPVMPRDSGRVAILQEPAAATAPNNLPECVIFGASPCLVYMQSAAHRYCDLEHGAVNRLISRQNGPVRVLTYEPPVSYPAECWAVVVVGTAAPQVQRWAKTPVGGIPERVGDTLGGPITCNIYEPVAGVLTATGTTAAVYNGSLAGVAGSVYVQIMPHGEDEICFWEDCG